MLESRLAKLKRDTLKALEEAKKKPDPHAKQLVGIAYTESHINKAFDELEMMLANIHFLKNGIPKIESEEGTERIEFLRQYMPNYKPDKF